MYGKVWDFARTKYKTEKGQFKVLKKPIYIHNNFHFGVMVCSELQKGTKMTEILKQSTNQSLTIDKIYDIKRRRSFLWVSKDYNF